MTKERHERCRSFYDIRQYCNKTYREDNNLLDNMLALCENMNDKQGEGKLIQKRGLPERFTKSYLMEGQI